MEFQVGDLVEVKPEYREMMEWEDGVEYYGKVMEVFPHVMGGYVYVAFVKYRYVYIDANELQLKAD